MSSEDEDDKPTVVLDLNALKRKGLKTTDDLTSAGRDLNELMGPIEFNVHAAEDESQTQIRKPSRFEVVLFDFQSEFFKEHENLLPDGFQYTFVKTLQELNAALARKEFKILVFNYDEQPKVVNQLTAQIKQKFAHVKTLIMAKSISPEKARAHAATASGANGYYQFPMLVEKLEAQFERLHRGYKA